VLYSPFPYSSSYIGSLTIDDGYGEIACADFPALAFVYSAYFMELRVFKAYSNCFHPSELSSGIFINGSDYVGFFITVCFAPADPEPLCPDGFSLLTL